MVSEVISLYFPFNGLRGPKIYVGSPVKVGPKAVIYSPGRVSVSKMESYILKERELFFHYLV